tara:strand:+ start:501 stop:782 length:282 start_codon:yes stop_codon:yes gene_type:complete
VATHVTVTVKRSVDVNPGAAKQTIHHLTANLLVALMEKLLTLHLHTASLLVVLTEEPLASSLRHIVDPLKVDLLKVDLHKAGLLPIDILDIRR